MNIKKNDTVIVLSGKDKGKKGKVLVAMPKDNKVIVEGVNVAGVLFFHSGSHVFAPPS